MNAIELIQGKSEALKIEITSPCPDPKQLQINLHVSLLACVKVVPLEIAKVFLNDEATGTIKYPQEYVELLENELLLFSKMLEDGLMVNARLLNQDQYKMQEEFVQCHNTFKKVITALVTKSRDIRAAATATIITTTATTATTTTAITTTTTATQ
eukprot:TRINITY_DN3565_c0_g1_i1.p2 TRINITY_DN3565_c0_g1~~TRINITY_DN3565_c0_g1_i1.p2  ORF type:complete len:155 (-),score=59.83 TRINITY_DN3565_c0_g1_i1:125-589(-)